MVGYNQTLATSTTLCLTESADGSFCAESVSTSEISYPLATIVILLQVVVFIFVIKWFSKKR